MPADRMSLRLQQRESPQVGYTEHVTNLYSYAAVLVVFISGNIDGSKPSTSDVTASPTTTAILTTITSIATLTQSTTVLNTITSIATVAQSTTAPTGTASSSSGGLSGGSIAGIVIGVIAFLSILGAILIFIFRRRTLAASPESWVHSAWLTPHPENPAAPGFSAVI